MAYNSGSLERQHRLSSEGDKTVSLSGEVDLRAARMQRHVPIQGNLSASIITECKHMYLLNGASGAQNAVKYDYPAAHLADIRPTPDKYEYYYPTCETSYHLIWN